MSALALQRSSAVLSVSALTLTLLTLAIVLGSTFAGSPTLLAAATPSADAPHHRWRYELKAGRQILGRWRH